MSKNVIPINIVVNVTRVITVLFLVNFPISFFVLLMGVIQTSLTKNNILNIYSSGLFFTYNQTKELANLLTSSVILYFFLQL